jgi:hypothetical protein
VLVRIGSYTVPSIDVDRLSEYAIDVLYIPGPGDLGITFDTSPCTTGTGQSGQRQSATPVDVSVTNFPGNCPDDLPGAIVIEPFDQTCVVASGISISTLTFPPTQAPGPSVGQILTISETTGASDLTVNSLSLTGRFFFDAGCSLQGAAGFTIPAGTGNSSTQVYFCPDTDNGSAYVGNLTVLSSAPSSPSTQSLSGQEAYPIMSVSPLDIDFGTTAGTVSFRITNSGTGDLNWTADDSDDPDGVFTVSSLGGVVAAGAFVDVDVTFALAVLAGTHTGSVDVDASDPDAVNPSETVTLAAETP